MSYNTIIAIAGNASIITRAAAAASAEGRPDPLSWAQAHSWELAAQPGWAAAWESTEASMTVNDNPDIGQREDVITDGMILASVQAIITAETPV